MNDTDGAIISFLVMIAFVSSSIFAGLFLALCVENIQKIKRISGIISRHLKNNSLPLIILCLYVYTIAVIFITIKILEK